MTGVPQTASEDAQTVREAVSVADKAASQRNYGGGCAVESMEINVDRKYLPSSDYVRAQNLCEKVGGCSCGGGK